VTDSVELTVDRLAKTGEGVAQHEGRAVFVDGTIPGERIRVRLSTEGQVVRGYDLEVVEPSPARRRPHCPLASHCGGCDWQHLDESVQLKHKHGIVIGALQHVGGIDLSGTTIEAPSAAHVSVGARRRATLHQAGEGLGFFGKASHRRVEVQLCPALTERLRELPKVIAKQLGTALKAIDEVRLLEVGGEVGVSLHLKGRLKPRLTEVAERLVRDGVAQQVVVAPEGAPPLVVGASMLDEANVKYRVDGFAQANAQVNDAIREKVVSWVRASPVDEVLELYAGNGNFTFAVADTAQQVTAIESSVLSVSLAQAGVRALGLNNVRLLQGDAKTLTTGLIREGRRFEVMLLDPPRAGAPGVALWAQQLLVRRVVYLACDPASLARDAKALVANGYRPTRLQSFDLFPQTRHVEALMCFERES
jgi:23S rRNA (uracil1939-C5)-methyltransferase